MDIRERVELINNGEGINEYESVLFEKILRTSESFNETPQVFVVGGWIRDKIFGIDSKDIDLMVLGIDNCEFCDKMKNLFPEYVSYVAKTQLKKVIDIPFILCQLILKDDSRIDVSNCVYLQGEEPLVSDAQRRDLTVNAIYYDIILKKIVDPLSCIDDCVNRIARPAGAAIQNFSNDQIQCIRAARIASKLSLTFMDGVLEDAKQSSRTPQVKLSRTLAWTHTQKALNHNSFPRFVQLLIEMDLFQVVFGDKNWDYPDILDRVGRFYERYPLNDQCNEILAIFLLSLVQKGNSISKNESNFVTFNTNASLIAAAANNLPKLENVPVARWIKSIGNDWGKPLKILHSQNEIHFAMEELIPFIHTNNLYHLATRVSHIKGKISQELAKMYKGAEIKEIYEKVFDYEVENPNASKEDVCLFLAREGIINLPI